MQRLEVSGAVRQLYGSLGLQKVKHILQRASWAHTEMVVTYTGGVCVFQIWTVLQLP